MILANENKSIVIEDTAQAFGCEYNGKKLGTFVDIGIFSFGKIKNTIKWREGGLIIINNSYLAKKCRSLINYGSQSSRKQYVHINEGINGKISDFQAAVLLSQTAKVEEIIQRRNKNGLILLKSINGLNGFRSITTEWNNMRNYYMPAFMYHGKHRFKKIKQMLYHGIPVSSPDKFPFPLFSTRF